MRIERDNGQQLFFSMEVKCIVSEKGKQLLVVNGNTCYEKRTLKNDEIIWQCSAEKRWTAKVCNQMDIITVSRCDTVHFHDTNEKKINKKYRRILLKEKQKTFLRDYQR